MRVLGIDPGLSRCGVGVVDGPGTRPTAIRVGVVRTDAQAVTAQRLAVLHAEITTVIAEAAPDAVAVERVFFNTNVRTAMGVGQAAGVILLAAAQAGVAVVEYTPTEVKAAVAGHGGADKAQVGYMVRALLRLADTPKPPDAADALALALCHLQRAGAHPGARAGTQDTPTAHTTEAAQGAHAGAGTQMSPRLAAAVEAAGPGAQVVER